MVWTACVSVSFASSSTRPCDAGPSAGDPPALLSPALRSNNRIAETVFHIFRPDIAAYLGRLSDGSGVGIRGRLAGGAESGRPFSSAKVSCASGRLRFPPTEVQLSAVGTRVDGREWTDGAPRA